MWRAVTDLDHWDRDLPSVVLIRRLDGPGPVGRGSRFHVRQRGLAPATYEVTEWLPEVGFTWAARVGSIITTAGHDLRGEDGLVRLRLAVRWSGRGAGMVRALYRARTQRLLDQEIAAFTRLAERAAAPVTAASGRAATGPTPAPDARAGRSWPALVVPVIIVWSCVQLALGVAWWLGAPGNPADPVVDPNVDLSVLGLLGSAAGAATLAALAAVGVVVGVLMLLTRRPDGPAPPALRRVLEAAAILLGVLLAVVIPDFRLLAAVAYTPIVVVLAVAGALPAGADVWPWPVVHQAALTVAGLTWLVAAVTYARAAPRWARPEVAARWGGWATAVAVVVPLGYATTRFAWALGIPLGVSQQLLDDLGSAVYAGAGLATMAVGGALLTVGLARPWGEVVPSWVPRLGGRRVPVAAAVVPATVVAALVASAGLMFVRLALSGRLDRFPGGSDNVAAWLPEMFWPLWGVALAAAAATYGLRRLPADR